MHYIAKKEEAFTTKQKILFEASMLFAENDYPSVSMKDIARKVKISAPALYNHYASKEAIFDAILENIEKVYNAYFLRLDGRIKQAENFSQVLDCLFEEVLNVHEVYIYYGFCLLTTMQFKDRKAYDMYNNVLIKKGIDYTSEQFDRCVRKGWARAFDTRSAATLFHNNIMMGTVVQVHSELHHAIPYDPTEMYTQLKRIILDFVEKV